MLCSIWGNLSVTISVMTLSALTISFSASIHMLSNGQDGSRLQCMCYLVSGQTRPILMQTGLKLDNLLEALCQPWNAGTGPVDWRRQLLSVDYLDHQLAQIWQLKPIISYIWLASWGKFVQWCLCSIWMDFTGCNDTTRTAVVCSLNRCVPTPL